MKYEGQEVIGYLYDGDCWCAECFEKTETDKDGNVTFTFPPHDLGVSNIIVENDAEEELFFCKQCGAVIN